MKSFNSVLLLLFAAITIQAKILTDTPTVVVFPNTHGGRFELEINAVVAENVDISFFEISGQLIQSEKKDLKIGLNKFEYTLIRQNEGVYFAKVEGVNWIRYSKMVLNNQTPDLLAPIDILHYDLSLSIQNLSAKTISGTTKVTVNSKVANLESISFDLLKLNVINVSINNQLQPFSQTDSTLFITLLTNRKLNDTFDLQITYNGKTTTDALWGGFYFSGNYAYNMGVAFQSKPHNFGRCWFPCIDNFTDRATYSFHITTDSSFVAVCNGLKQPEVKNADGSITWNWHLSQTIPTYLASVAVGKYEFIKYEFTGLNRTYPIWLATVAADTAKAKASFAKLNNALQCFEEKFGAYPFEKVGFVGVPFNAGAMEHATNIAYPNYAINGNINYETLFAHELSHMWWGDLATCRTAEDMWLNEGWASYCEALFLECAYGKERYMADIKAKSIEVMKTAAQNDGAWYPVSGVPHEATYGTHVYKKGALIVHTLRNMMGDSAFFAACQSYLSLYRFTDVSSENLKNEFQRFTSINLTNFFMRWIYEPGNIDVALLKTMENTTPNGIVKKTYELSEWNRYKKGYNDKLPIFVEIYYKDSISKKNVILKNGSTTITTLEHPLQNPIQYIMLNENQEVILGKNIEKVAVGKTGSISLPNVNINLNVQKIVDSALLIIEHHWSSAPIPFSLHPEGIRISGERYWTVSGILPTSFETWAYFNYDGLANSFLDTELLQQVINEDSILLLYRPDNGFEWQIHTDHTFQPFSSKTDKIGRFWVNKLKKGDYAFGLRDSKAVGLIDVKTPQKEKSFLIVPNPANDNLTIQFKESIYVKRIHLYSLQGALIKNIIIEQKVNQVPVNISFLNPNQYIILAELSDKSLSEIFIKK